MMPLSLESSGQTPELIPALWLAELSSGHSPHVSTPGSPTDRLQLAEEIESICHCRINLLSEINLSNWSEISNNNKALPDRGQGPKGLGHSRGDFYYLDRSLRK